MPKRKKDPDLTPDKLYLADEETSLKAWESLVPPKDAKCILSCDPGTSNAAFCLLTIKNNKPSVITSKIEMPDFKTKEAKVQYIAAITAAWVKEYNPDIFVKEGPSHFAKFGVIESGKVQAMLEFVAYRFNKPLITIPPTSIRSFMGVGKKGLDKSDTKLSLYKKYGLEFASTDEADAAAIAFTGLAIARGEYTVTKAVKKSRKKKVND